MIDPKHEVAVSRQAELLGISRSAVYYAPRPVPQADLALMRRIDELHLEYPFAGARTLRDLLRASSTLAQRGLREARGSAGNLNPQHLYS